MFRRILIPLDGSETAERVLPTVEKMLLREDAVAVLVRIVFCPMAGMPHPPTLLGELEKSALDYLRKTARALEDKGLVVETRVIHGDPAETILEYAVQEECDLIAMSTHGRTGVTRFLMGSVAEKVLRNSPRPVLAVRAFDGEARALPPRPFKNLLLPIDETPESETIIQMGIWVAKLYGSKIILLHVVKPAEFEHEFVNPTAHERAMGERLAGIVERIRAEGCTAISFIRHGDPAHEILSFAEENPTDLICMTTHGRKGIARWMMGSVAERVLRHAKTPLLLVRLTKSALRRKAHVSKETVP